MGALLAASSMSFHKQSQRMRMEKRHSWMRNILLEEKLKPLQGAPVPEQEEAHPAPVPELTAFPIQVQVTGKTGGYEKQFLHDVTKLLAGQGISLQVEDYKENSERFLFLFCPVATTVAADINNALTGLSVQKALLVVLHHKPKNSTGFLPDSKPPGQHPALVATVHARYSMQDGFYHCPANENAVSSVAAAIEQFKHKGK